MRVRTAVIPAAGLGKRFLPVTKAVPKELLPIVDVPALQLIVDEAVAAGVERIVIVTSDSKPGIEAYFTPSPEVEAALDKLGRTDAADKLRRIGSDIEVSFALQDQPLGLGHAVGCARDLVGDEPFAVLLPDEIMGDSSLLDQMARLCEATDGSVVGLKEIPAENVSSYGVIDPSGPLDEHGVVPVRDLVEKPPVAEAPSNLIIIGRYVLTPDVFDEIAVLKPGAVGELQLTDALKAQAARSPFHGVLSRIARHDTGTPALWLNAVVEFGLAHPEIGPGFREWLTARVAVA